MRKAIILVGGLGTRMRPLTFSIPKPLLPVNETPILQVVIERLRASGITDIVLATGYQSELFRLFCGDGSKFSVSISYVKEEKPLGTAGPLSLVQDHVADEENFLVINGDILTDFDVRELAIANLQSCCDLTIGYTEYIYRSPFGVLDIQSGLVRGISEKPEQKYLVSAGIYCLRPRVFAFIPFNEFLTMPELVSKMIAAGCQIDAYRIEHCWMGLETIPDFESAIRELSRLRPFGES
jgi:NDP-sugar pyrophosphorylase family protein